MLKRAFSKADLNEMAIDDAITQSLVVDFEMNDYQAIDIYFNSKTYSLLIDEKTGYYEKPWQEIYEMLNETGQHAPTLFLLWGFRRKRLFFRFPACLDFLSIVLVF